MKPKYRLILLAAIFSLLSLGVLATLSAEARPAHPAPADCVPGPHSGVITADQTWCLSDGPVHLMSAGVTVAQGATLTIEPGVVVKAGATNLALTIKGQLDAAGTEELPIVFTSQADNGPKQWKGIIFDGGVGLLRHAEVRYAGTRTNLCGVDVTSAAIHVLNVQAEPVTIQDSQVRDSSSSSENDYGLCVKDSRVVVTDTTISGIGDNAGMMDYPVYISGPTSDVNLSGLRLENNIYNRVILDLGAMTGHDFTLSAQPAMDGYELYRGVAGEHFIVPAAVTMTVEPGVTVFNSWDINKHFVVQGRLEADGTEAAPVTFTSHTDSGPGQWDGIIFDGGTGLLHHAVVRYAGGRTSLCGAGANSAAIHVLDVQAGSVTIQDSQVRDSSYYDNHDFGLCIKDSRVVVADTTISGIGDNAGQMDYPIYISGPTSDVSLSGLRLENNIYNRVILDLGAMTGHDFTLSAQPAMDGYELYRGVAGEHFIVPANITMTVEPGVTVFNNWDINKHFVVQGRLEADGTEAAPVTFTSHANSSPGQWSGITFDGGTGLLRHAVVRYAGRGSYGFPGTASGISAVNVLTGELRIENSQIRDISGSIYPNYGLALLNSRAVVSNTLFTGISDAWGSYPAAIFAKGDSTLELSNSAVEYNARNGLFVEGSAQVQIANTAIVQNLGHGILVTGDTAKLSMTGSTVLANSQDGVRNNGKAQVTLGGAEGQGNSILGNGGYGANQAGTGTQMIATHNWWGDISGPYHPSLNPDGQGEKVSDRVLFDPWAVDWQGTTPAGVYVAVGGPRTAPPGGSAAYTVSYHNGRAETITDAVLELQLPAQATFVSASHSGIYWPQRHEVVWRLGNLAPDASGFVAVQTRYNWGLPNGTLYAVQARLGAPDLPLGLSEPQDYLNFETPVLTEMTALTPAQFAAELTAHPELEALYNAAIAAGFVDGGAVRIDLETGQPITQAVLIHPAQGVVRFVRRQGDQALATTFAAQTYTVQTPDSSMAVDWRTDAISFTGLWGSGEARTPAGQAYDSCRVNQLPGPVLDEKATLLAQTFASAKCYPCRHGGDCSACGAALHHALPLPEAVESLACLPDAGKMAMPASLSASQNDPSPILVKVSCRRSWEDWWNDRPWTVIAYGLINGRLDGTSFEVKCDKGQSCKTGIAILQDVEAKTGKVGCVCTDKPKPKAQTNSTPPLYNRMSDSSVCSASEAEGVSRCQRTEIFRPKDPNAKYGLDGDLVPGQLVTYTITYENEGAGRAYGVFITDKLDEAFDPDTLVIQGPGQFIAANRTLLWDIGELRPKGDPDSQGEVSFTVQLRADTPIGTAVVNQAIVFFPTVGEETPTNPVINFVRPLAAIPLRLETGYMQPVDVNLAGREPEAAPLTYRIIDEPLNGILSGAPPNLIYTPAENFTGLERFTFTVSNGASESLPAEVLIEVGLGDDDTISPQVIWASPIDGSEVPFSVIAVTIDDAGSLFAPILQAQFSEALDPDSISAQTVHLVADGGDVVPIKVVYDPRASQVTLLPRAALQGSTWYIVTLTTGITDLAGNPLAVAYTWRFLTEPAKLHNYLPMVIRDR